MKLVDEFRRRRVDEGLAGALEPTPEMPVGALMVSSEELTSLRG